MFSTYVFLNPFCASTASCPVGWTWLIGTSMASPHVAGAAALVADKNPNLSPREIRSILKETAQDMGDRLAFGHGMLDVAAAVNQ